MEFSIIQLFESFSQSIFCKNNRNSLVYFCEDIRKTNFIAISSTHNLKEVLTEFVLVWEKKNTY